MGPQALHLIDQEMDPVVERDLGQIEEGGALDGRAGVGKVADLDTLEGPAVGFGDEGKLGRGLRQGHHQTGLAAARPLEDELQAQGGLARPGHALHEIEVTGKKAPAQDVIQTPHARGDELRPRLRHVRPLFFPYQLRRPILQTSTQPGSVSRPRPG